MTLFMKFNDFIDKIFLPYVLKTRELSTYHKYEKDLRLFRQQIGNMRMIFITKKTIKALLKTFEDRGLKQNTICGYFKVINAIFNFAVKNKNIFRNPCRGIWVKDGTSCAGVFTPEEINKLLGRLKNKYPLIWLPTYIAFNTGMRRGEIVGLTWSNVDLNRKEILVKQSLCRTVAGVIYIKKPKTDSGIRIIAISDEVVEVLKKIKNKSNCEFVVAGWNGKCMDPQYLTNYFSKAVRECDISNHRFHDLRHTHASLLLAAGVSINVVSARLGHATIEITLKVYSHMLPGQQHAAAEAFSKGMKDGFIRY